MKRLINLLGQLVSLGNVLLSSYQTDGRKQFEEKKKVKEL
jgi:hypothetical protein